MLEGIKSMFGLKKKVTAEHPDLGTLIFFDGDQPYWEAEFKRKGQDPISIALPDNDGKPDEGAIEFVMNTLNMDVADLMALCGQIVVDEWTLWVEQDWPEDVDDQFNLVGIDAPIDGDVEGQWSISFNMSEDENHIMTVLFEDGIGQSVTFDG